MILINKHPERIIYRKDLIKPHNLKSMFKRMRNYLAGNLSGVTRDEILAEQLIYLLFCKIQDELKTKTSEAVVFQRNHPKIPDMHHRILDLFKQIKIEYKTVFNEKDELTIDNSALLLIVTELEEFCITEASRDAIGDAFEIFLGPSLRGNKGQFFTPKNIVKTMIKILNPVKNETILDPACGSGGFLIEAATYSRKEQNESNKENHTKKTIKGIEKDQFLAKIANIYLTMLGEPHKSIYCENSLIPPTEWQSNTFKNIFLNQFDIVVTNPPFGVKIPIKSEKTLKQYELGHKWRKKKKKKWEKTKTIQKKQPPQILFIERCLNFLREGGRMGIVLPDGIFGNPSNRYIIQFLLERTKLIAVISCSHLTFLPHTHTKTSLLFIEKTITNGDYSFFMAIAGNVGHDKNGKPLYLIDKSGNPILNKKGDKILNDDFPRILENYFKHRNSELTSYSHLGFTFNKSDIINNILIPEYYDPDILQQLKLIQEKGEYQLVAIRKLIDENIIQITRGHEIGSKFYGTGDIPFIRTSDLINLELNIDPKKKVSREIFNVYKEKQDIKANDILLVCDGTFLIGKTAMINEDEIEVIIQSHFKKIRVLKHEILDEYILLWALNTDIVQKQIKAKTFIQATISTLGNRIEEIIIPIPLETSKRQELSNEIKDIMNTKRKLKQRLIKSLNVI